MIEVNIIDDKQYPIEIILSSGINKFTEKASIELEQKLRLKNREFAINNKNKFGGNMGLVKIYQCEFCGDIFLADDKVKDGDKCPSCGRE